MKIKQIILFLIMCSIAFFASASEIDKTKEANILELLRITNSLEVAKQASKMSVDQVLEYPTYKNRPEIVEIIKQVTEKQLNEFLIGGGKLETGLIELYAKYFSNDDIKAMLNFYKSETGQKTIHIMPALMQDSLELGKEFQFKIMDEIEKKVKQLKKKK